MRLDAENATLSPAMSAALLRDAVEESSGGYLERFGEDHDGGEARRAVGALDLGDGGGVQPGVSGEVLLGPAALRAEGLEVDGEAGPTDARCSVSMMYSSMTEVNAQPSSLRRDPAAPKRLGVRPLSWVI
jgi:hypothetical protein